MTRGSLQVRCPRCGKRFTYQPMTHIADKQEVNKIMRAKELTCATTRRGYIRIILKGHMDQYPELDHLSFEEGWRRIQQKNLTVTNGNGYLQIMKRETAERHYST